MNVSKHGFRVDNGMAPKKRQPLEFALDMIDFYKVIDGIECVISVPRMSHLRQELKKDGWRMKK